MDIESRRAQMLFVGEERVVGATAAFLGRCLRTVLHTLPSRITGVSVGFGASRNASCGDYELVQTLVCPPS